MTMTVKRFAARTSREALALVREALGEDAVVLSTKPCAEGVEVMAMAPGDLQQAEAAGAQSVVQRAPRPAAAAPGSASFNNAAAARPMTLAERIAARGEQRPDAPRAGARIDLRQEPSLGPAAGAGADIDPGVADDVQTLGMSTLTFQDYVRERMLRRRQADLEQNPPSLPDALVPPRSQPVPRSAAVAATAVAAERAPERSSERAPERQAALPQRNAALRQLARREPPVLRDELRLAATPQLADDDADDDEPLPRRSGPPQRQFGQPGLRSSSAAGATSNAAASTEVMGELREVRQLIEERFGMLAFMERLQRDPRQVALLQKLFDAGLSPGLVRKMVQALPADASDELAWATGVLERNLLTSEPHEALEDHSGVIALIGPTGVGKTTTTAKIAAAFATQHGAAHLGLITLDAYRVAAHEQLRTYGRILGVPVHTAHDRASLEDLLELLSSKKLVLIDTAGVAQRDARTRETLEMLSHPAIQKVLVLNAAAQGETVDDVMLAYGVANCRGVILSKLDEAVKLAPALDALIRHRARVLGVANGQRVPEDWHRLSAQALVQRAMRGGGTATWRLDANEVNLVFAGTQGASLDAARHLPRPADLHA
jgi:flagellar biosynthesis protein FlhF